MTYWDTAALVASALAALFGLRAATIKVRNSLDDFISDLQRQGRWTTYTAVCAAVATLLQVLGRLTL